MAGGQVVMHRAFELRNYLLLGAHLPPEFAPPRSVPVRLLLVFLHAITTVLAAAGCSGSFTTPAAGTGAHHNAHTAGAVRTTIFQGAAVVVAFTRTADFLAELRCYVREDDGVAILRLIGGLGAAIFVLEWASLALAFTLQLREDGSKEAAKQELASVYQV